MYLMEESNRHKMEINKKFDKFYTLSKTSSRLIVISGEVLGLDLKTSPTLEPSAGSGSFSLHLSNCVAYDLLPESSGIIQQDFLQDFIIPDVEQRVSIGNPPFGKKGKLAIEFLNKCGKLSKAVCFILPSTFRRWSVQNKVDKSLRLIYDEDLPLDSFEFNGKPYSLNCIFQIWTRELRPDLPDLRLSSRPPTTHPDLQIWQYNGTVDARKFLNEDWDVAVYRQGYKDYSRVFTRETDFDEVKNIIMNTRIQMMLIKFNVEKAKEVFQKMDLVKLSRNNLSTPGFGKADFIAEYGKYLKAQYL